MKPKMTSNSGVFAKLGNPWVSERDRQKDFPLDPSENPDMDMWTKASYRKPRHERGQEPSGVIVLDAKRRKANALHKMNAVQIRARHSRLLTK